MPDDLATSRYETIERLRREVSASQCSLLDRGLIDIRVITHGAEAFRASPGCSDPIHCDIPIESVVSLGRKEDTWMAGDTWRDVVMRRLHGTDWPIEVFDYFENEISDRPFPAPHARGALELTSYGGVSICANGNHRLAAAYCWLAATRGSDACLKRVVTRLIPIDREKARRVLNFAQDSHTLISVCSTPSPWLTSELPWKTYIRSDSNGECTYFGLGTDLEPLWPVKTGFFGKLVRRFPDDSALTCLDSQDWYAIPHFVLEAWSTGGWFDGRFASAACGDGTSCGGHEEDLEALD